MPNNIDTNTFATMLQIEADERKSRLLTEFLRTQVEIIKNYSFWGALNGKRSTLQGTNVMPDCFSVADRAQLRTNFIDKFTELGFKDIIVEEAKSANHNTQFYFSCTVKW